MPWFIVIVWYMAPALVGHIDSVAVELIWAFAVTFISAIIGCSLEKNIERTSFTKGIKIAVTVMFILSIVFYVRFSFTKPWIDLFINPENL
ncbi:MAG: hypothetical protein ACK40Q_07740 [Pseudothermotoga sp.]